MNNDAENSQQKNKRTGTRVKQHNTGTNIGCKINPNLFLIQTIRNIMNGCKELNCITQKSKTQPVLKSNAPDNFSEIDKRNLCNRQIHKSHTTGNRVMFRMQT